MKSWWVSKLTDIENLKNANKICICSKRFLSLMTPRAHCYKLVFVWLSDKPGMDYANEEDQSDLTASQVKMPLKLSYLIWWTCPRRIFLTSPLGPRVNLSPRSEICPLGGMFNPSFTPRGDHSLLFRRRGGREFHPQRKKSPLGDNFAPGVKVCT
jgi:hypothetical protein